jgi:hypothetical protein
MLTSFARSVAGFLTRNSVALPFGWYCDMMNSGSASREETPNTWSTWTWLKLCQHLTRSNQVYNFDRDTDYSLNAATDKAEFD